MEILFADDALAVCVKEPGMLSQDGGEGSVPDALRRTIGGEAFALHRLDRAVGGVMLCARSAKAAGDWTRALTQTGEKQYLAVVAGDPGEEGTYTDLLYHDPRSNKTFVVQRMRRGVREATLRFKRLAAAEYSGTTLSLVRIVLETGRTHQIRVQFASRGMPVAGDRRYGSRVQTDSPALWCARVTLLHPETGARLTFEAKPQAFPFDLFTDTERGPGD